MNIIPTRLPGVVIFEPKVFGDARGFFVETFRQEWLAAAGIKHFLIQDNHSRSRKGVLRGLHWQMQQTQGKLVRVSSGAVYDVAVDVRLGSPTFGQWEGLMLDDVLHRQLYIPPGFAHGFCVVSETADFHYKCSNYYHPSSEAGVIWNDPDIGITWPAGFDWALSAKDALLPKLRDQTRLPQYSDFS